MRGHTTDQAGDPSLDRRATVTFGGVIRRLDPGDVLSFGRGSDDLDLGDNPALHRRFGRIFWRSDSWWLHNEGSRLTVSIHDRTSTSAVRLAAGREVSLSFPESALRVEAGDHSYEILVDLPVDGSAIPAPRTSESAEATIDHSMVPLTADQRLLLVALAADRLADPHGATDLPTNKSVARRLGWTQTQFNRKLDRLCGKFSRHGVAGLAGDVATLAVNRRLRLVDHVVEVGIITSDDLELLADFPQ